MKTVSYKGYQASVEFEDGTLFVKVLHIEDVLVAECDSASEVQKVAEELVDAYLQDCAEEGREPSKPFKGSFNVRVTPELHRRSAMRASQEGMSLNSWIASALEEKLECSRLADRIDGVVAKSKIQIEEATINRWISAKYYNAIAFAPDAKQKISMRLSHWNDENDTKQQNILVAGESVLRQKLHA